MSSDFDGFDESEADNTPQVDGDNTRPWWDEDGALESLKMEKSVHTDESNEALAKRLLDEAGPAAAASIIHLALHSRNDNTRLAASRYVVDKFYDEQAGANAAKWEDLLGEMVSTAELFANSPANPSTPTKDTPPS